MAFATATDLLHSMDKWGPKFANVKAAQAFIDERKDEALNNQQDNKYHRPWKIVDLTKALPKDQAWIGIEFETGFDCMKEYQKVVNFLWDDVEYAAIDREGSGDYPIEIAFAPEPMENVLKGTTAFERTLQFFADNKLTCATNPTCFTCRDIGIHAGLSTPATRALGDGLWQVTSRLDRILLSLNDKQRKKLYGRTELHWEAAHDRGTYIELKMFKSVPDLDVARGFLQVIQRVGVLADFLIANPEVRSINNTYEFLSGEDAEPRID